MATRRVAYLRNKVFFTPFLSKKCLRHARFRRRSLWHRRARLRPLARIARRCIHWCCGADVPDFRCARDAGGGAGPIASFRTAAAPSGVDPDEPTAEERESEEEYARSVEWHAHLLSKRPAAPARQLDLVPVAPGVSWGKAVAAPSDEDRDTLRAEERESREETAHSED